MNMNNINDAMMNQINSTNSYNYNALGGKTWFHPEEMKIKKNSNSVNVELIQNSINSKLKGYLLNKEHPGGGPKANWFEKALGFNPD